MSVEPTFFAPTRPFSIEESYLRRAAATGSVRTAQLASRANFNGHAVSVYWNDYRKFYVADYTWAGRNVLARGTFQACLEAALAEYDRGAMGASVKVVPREDDLEALEACRNHPQLRDQDDMSWYTWRHKMAAQCAPDAACPNRLRPPFNLELLIASESERDYLAKVWPKA